MTFRSLARILLAASIVSVAGQAMAEPPMRVEASARQGDGKLLFAGSAGPASVSVGRLNNDGSYDGTFGAAGVASYSPPGGAATPCTSQI